MQIGVSKLVSSGSQTMGNYRVPTLGVAATAVATLDAGPNGMAWVILVSRQGLVFSLPSARLLPPTYAPNDPPALGYA